MPSDTPPTAKLTTPLGPDAFRVVGVRGREALSELFEFEVDAVSDKPDLAFDQLLGQGATVELSLPDGGARPVHGIVRSVAQGATERRDGAGAVTRYRLVLAPKLWLLTRRRQSRTFQQMAVPDILRAALEGLEPAVELQGTYEPRDYCVQYRETDFDFVSRLMEEEGIFYFFRHSAGAHELVVADAPTGHPAVPSPATLKYTEHGAGGTRAGGRVTAWEKEQTLTASKVTLWDHSFELPGRALEAESPTMESVAVGTVTHKLKLGATAALELYDYPGGYAKRFDGTAPGGGERASDVQKIFQDNKRTADLRMHQEEARAIRVRGESDCAQLTAGHKFTFAEHPHGAGEYVVLSVSHDFDAGDVTLSGDGREASYANRFACLPAGLPFRPARATPRPRVDGCQTAVVVGPAGEEIFTDRYGRVKVQFHWDRAGKKDADSSCWVRVASTWAGKQWGAVHLPRVGQEVVVDFVEGDPDRPLIVGSVYNADQMPPYVLPDNKTQSGVKTRSAKQGTNETYNELRFEDKKGEEHVHLHAEKDLQVVVEHDETRTVGNDRTTLVTRHDTTDLKNEKDGQLSEGNQALTIHKGKQDVTLKEGNQTVVLTKGDQTVTLTQGNQTVEVKQGNRALTVNGNDATKVTTGNRTVVVADGDETLTVDKGKHGVQVKMGDGAVTLDMGNYSLVCKMGNISIKANLGSITLEAMQGIELKCGASSVKVDQTGVTVKGMMAKVEGTAMAQVKSPMTQVNGDAMLMAKGGVTMIN
jgi:type VI secretion system secreted protein VgrG